MKNETQLPEDYKITFATPKRYNWNPKEDITPYELAICIPLLLDRLNPFPFIDEKVKRHFDEIE